MKYLIIPFIILLFSANVQADNEKFSIGAGRKISNYHLIAEEICDQLNKTDNRYQAIISKGSLNNLEMLINEKIDVAFLQYDHFIEYNKKNLSNTKILPILKLYNESLTIITTADSDIKNFDDLNGKKVSTNGMMGGSRLLMNKLSEIMGNGFNINYVDSTIDNDLIDDICNKNIDALTLMVSHPNILVSEINRECPIRFVEIPNKLANKFTQAKKYGYFKYVIPDNIYKGILYPSYTIGTNNIIAVNSNEKDDVVYKILKITYDIINSNNSYNYVLRKIESEFHRPEGEIHPGAEKFFLSLQQK